MRLLDVIAAGSLACSAGLGQNPVPDGAIPSAAGIAIFHLPPGVNWSAPEAKAHASSDFVKKFTIRSFGYGASPVGPGFAFAAPLTGASFASDGLECPYCAIQPAMIRSKFTLPPFGAEASVSLLHGRMQLFGGYGGVDAWKPDAMFDPMRPHMSSIDDAWLMQGDAGARVALDRQHRVWLGALDRYVSNLGGEGMRHWNTYAGTLTFSPGR